MKLTDDDKDKIRSALEGSACDTVIEPTDIAIYLAGKRAGREDMRERAARVCDELHNWQTINNQEHGREWHDAADAAAAGVRALGVDDD